MTELTDHSRLLSWPIILTTLHHNDIIMGHCDKSSSPAPNITDGLLVFVQLVMADITTEPTQ